MLQTPLPEQAPEIVATAVPSGLPDLGVGATPGLWDCVIRILPECRDLIPTAAAIPQGLVAIGIIGTVVGTFIGGFAYGLYKVFRRLQLRYARRSPVWAAPVVAGHKITSPPDDFTGRSDELTELHRQHDRGRRVLGIFGMGGVGKSVLARQLAEELHATYPDEQIDIALSGMQERPTPTRDALVQIITTLRPDLADTLPSQVDDLCRVYRDTIRGKRGILLLDNAANADQILPILARPLDGGSNWLILVTAREAFAPDDLSALTLETLAPPDAALFMTELVPRIKREIAESIARRCGYLPHALRVAGRTLTHDRTLDPAVYLHQLERHDRRLGLAVAALDESYQRLRSAHRSTWRRLSVFPGSFDLAAAAAVLGERSEHAERSLALLVRRSLVEFDESSGRYVFHDLARDFARARLERLEYPQYIRPLARLLAWQFPRLREEYITRYRFARYFAAVLAQADALYIDGGASLTEGLQLFDREAANIRAGQAWAATQAPHDRDAARITVSYITLHTSNLINLRVTPGERLFWAEAAISAMPAGDLRAEMGTCLDAGNACIELGRFQEAIVHWQRRHKLARLLGDPEAEGGALGGLGIAFNALGDHQRAIEYYEQALVIRREVGDRRSEGIDLGNLGNAYQSLGDHQRAIDLYNEALVIRREVGDRRSEGNALGNLGNAYQSLGEHQRAIDLYKEALDIRREVGDRRSEGINLLNLAEALLKVGEPKQARACADEGIAIAQETGYELGEAIGRFLLGCALHALAQPEDGVAEVRQALSVFERLDDAKRAQEAREQLTEWGCTVDPPP